MISSVQQYTAAKADTAQRTVLKINDKSASTNSITFQTIDPKVANKKAYTLTYEPLNSDGTKIIIPTVEIADWT